MSKESEKQSQILPPPNVKKSSMETSVKLKQRLYASYSQTHVLIPNELIGSVKNSLDDFDEEEITKRKPKKVPKTKLTYSTSRPQFEDSLQIGKMPTISLMKTLNVSEYGAPERSTLPPLANPPKLPKIQPATTKHTEKSGFLMPSQRPVKPFQLQPITPMVKTEMNATSPEIEMQSQIQAKINKKNMPRVKKVIKGGKDRSIRVVEDKELSSRTTHLDLIRLIEDGKKAEHDEYYYCKRAKSMFYAFYSVAFNEINTEKDDYITISSRGVTHFINKEAEFMTLAEWKEEVDNYRKINYISFFQNFRKSKSFTLWKKLVKKTKMLERGAFLSKELFQADPHLNNKLIEIRKLLQKLYYSDILQLVHDEAMSIDKLSGSISQKQNELKEQIIDKEYRIKLLINAACESSILEFNQNTRMFGKEENKHSENKEETPYNIFADDTYHPMPFTVLASTKTLYKRLARYIRMIDYMMTQLKLSIIKNSYNNLLNVLVQKESPLKRNVAIFKIQAVYNEDELLFVPTLSEVKDGIILHLKEGIRMIAKRPPLGDEDKFKPYMSTFEEKEDKEESTKANPLKSLEDEKEMQEKIVSALDLSFTLLNEYRKELIPFIEIYRDHCKLDFAKLEGESDTRYRQWVEKFDRDKFKVKEGMEDTRLLRIIKVDASHLKELLLEKPTASRTKMAEIMPEHSQKIVVAMSGILADIAEKIVTNTNWEVDEYVTYKRFIDEQKKKTEEYEEAILKARSLQGIMNDSQMNIPAKNKKELDSLESKWKNVKDKLKSSSEAVDGKESLMKNILIKKGPEVNAKLKEISLKLDDEKFYCKETDTPEVILEHLMAINQEIVQIASYAKKVQSNQAYMQIPKDEFQELDRLKERHSHYLTFWQDKKLWIEKKAVWSKTQIMGLSVAEMSDTIKNMRETAVGAEQFLKEQFEISFELSRLFREKELEPMQSTIGVVENILRKEVDEEHWKIFQGLLDCKYKRDNPELTLMELSNLIAAVKQAHKESHKDQAPIKIEDEIREKANQAAQEHKLSSQLDAIKKEWENMLLPTEPVLSKVQIKDSDILFNTMNELLINLNKLMSNEYAERIRPKAEQIYQAISQVEELLTEIIEVQRKMKIVDEMQKVDIYKGKEYDEAQKPWKKLLKKDPNKEKLHARFATDNKGNFDYFDICRKLNAQMDQILKSIVSSIEEKQKECPRLFFIPCQELMMMLCENDKLKLATNCLKCCFASIGSILTVEENEELYPAGIISAEGEEFKHPSTLKARAKLNDQVEKIVLAVEENMRKDIRGRIKKYFSDYLEEKKGKLELVTSSIYQVGSVGESLIFTANTELVLDEEDNFDENMSQYIDEQSNYYLDAAELMYTGKPSSMSEVMPGKNTGSFLAIVSSLTDDKRLALSSLIIQYVHNRDIATFLLNNQVIGSNSFYWQMQLRYYIQSERVIIRQMDSTFEYCNEYLGIKYPYPITPPVERCWVSITNALRNKFFTSVIGSSGYDNHAIHAIQDLASAFGKYSFYFSCTPTSTYSFTTPWNLDKLLMAAAASFSWIIISDIIKMQPGSLSAFVSSLCSLRQVLIEEKTDWSTIIDRNIRVVPMDQLAAVNCPYMGIFLTYSANEGKFSSNDVPQHIKNYFRPVALLHLNIMAFAECWLLSAGFQDGDTLGKKLGCMMIQGQEILADSEDFNFRALEAIIRLAAKIKREGLMEKNEKSILLSALQRYYRKALNENEYIIYEKLEKLIFFDHTGTSKNKEIPRFSSTTLLKTSPGEIVIMARQMNIPENTYKKLNLMQELMEQQQAIFLIGDAAVGKTWLLNTFLKCNDAVMNSASASHSEIPPLKSELETIYPKSQVSLKHLYGYFDNSHAWVEGLLGSKMKAFSLKSVQDKHQYKVLHCDGPIENDWIYILIIASNTGRLILGNGDMIYLQPTMKFIFESNNLQHAAPSNFGNAAVMFVEDQEILFPQMIVENWLDDFSKNSKIDKDIKEYIKTQISTILFPAIADKATMPRSKELMFTLNDNMIAQSFCSIFESVYCSIADDIVEKTDRSTENLKKLISKLTVFSLVWSFGSSLPSSKFQKVDEYIGEAVTNPMDKPKESSAFEACIQIKEGGYADFVPWGDLHAYKHIPHVPMSQIIVPTKQLIAYKYFVETLALASKHCILYGESGTGKSLVPDFLRASIKEVEATQIANIPTTPKASLTPLSSARKVEDNSSRSQSKTNAAYSHIFDPLAKFCCTYHSNAENLESFIYNKLNKMRMNLLSPQNRKRAVLFIDDINLPNEESSNILDESGLPPQIKSTSTTSTNSCIELLRLIAEKSGFFDTTRNSWFNLANTSFVMAASPPYGHRKKLSERFYRHFIVLNMNTTSLTEMQEIYDKIFTGHFALFSKQLEATKTMYLDSFIELNEFVKQKFPGSPKFPFYTISFKDLSKVLSGILLVKPTEIKSQEHLTRLFIHECLRVFGDRYIEKTEVLNLAEQLEKIVEKNLSSKWKIREEIEKAPLYFSVLPSLAKENAVSIYAECRDWKEVKFSFEENEIRVKKLFLEKGEKYQPVLFFKEAVEHMIKLARVFTIPGMNALQIGPESMSRRTFMNVLARMMNKKIYQLEYHMKEFETSYKAMYGNIAEDLLKCEKGELKSLVVSVKVGKKLDEPIYGEYSQIILDDLYQMLSTGELVNYINYSRAPGSISFRSIDEHHSQTISIKKNLHFLITIPYATASQFNNFIIRYPNLFTDCQQIYQHQWPAEAASAIARATITSISPLSKIKFDLADVFVNIHNTSVKESQYVKLSEGIQIIIMPNFVNDMIQKYAELYESKAKELEQKRSDYEKAIANITLCGERKEHLMNESMKLKPDMEAKQNAVSQASAKYSDQDNEIHKIKTEILHDESAATGGAKFSRKVPTEKVTEKLELLKKELVEMKGKVRIIDWRQLKSVVEPHPLIVSIVKACFILLGEKLISTFDQMQKIMGKTKSDAMQSIEVPLIHDFSIFEAKLLYEDAKALPADKRKEYENSTGIIFDWIGTVIKVFEENKKCYGVTTDIDKKKDLLFEKMQNLSQLEKIHKGLKSELDKISKMRMDLESKSQTMHEVEHNIIVTSPEWAGIKEWQEALNEVIKRQKTLIGDMIMATAILIYGGPFPADARKILKEKWKKIIKENKVEINDDVKISQVIGETNVLSDWHNHYLFREETCIENALILKHTKKCPIIIDPEGAGLKWLSFGRKKFKATSHHLIEDISKEMASGNEVILDEVSRRLSPEHMLLLEFPRNVQMMYKFPGMDKPVEVLPSYAIFFRTENSQIKFKHNVWESATIINFGLNQKGLQDLIAIEYGNVATVHEFEDLTLLRDDPLNKERLDKENILINLVKELIFEKVANEALTEQKDKILDMKSIICEVRKKIFEKKEETQKEWVDKIPTLGPFCKVAGVVYRSISKLRALNGFYLYPFDKFMEWMVTTMNTPQEVRGMYHSQSSMTVMHWKERFAQLEKTLLQRTIANLSRSMLFEDFKLAVFLLAVNLSIGIREEITYEEWTQIMLSGASNQVKNPRAIPMNRGIQIMSQEQWNLLQLLEKLNPELYQGMSEDIISHTSEWLLFMGSKKPYTVDLPGKWKDLVKNDCQKMLLVRIFCPEKLVEMVYYIIENIFPEEYPNYILKPAQINIQQILTKEVKYNHPLLILKEDFEDITPIIKKIALSLERSDTKTEKGEKGESKSTGDKLETMTLSPSTFANVQALINKCKLKQCEKPEWVLIREIDSVKDMAMYLRDLIIDLNAKGADIQFLPNDKLKLIFTCNSINHFPFIIPHNCVRIAISSDKTMKGRIVQDISRFQNISILSKEKPNPNHVRMSMAIAILHATMKKRNCFGELAWRHPFDMSKLEVDSLWRLAYYAIEGIKDPGTAGATAIQSGFASEKLPLSSRFPPGVALGGYNYEDYDQRMINEFMGLYLNEDVTQGDFSFHESGIYKIIKCDSYKEIIDYLVTIPLGDDYALCEMDPSWTLAAQRKEAEDQFKLACKVEKYFVKEPEEDRATTMNMELVMSKIAEALPDKDFNKDDLSQIMQDAMKVNNYGMPIYALQEMNRYNSFFAKARSLMKELRHSLANGQQLTDELSRIYITLEAGLIPEEFIGYSWDHSLAEWLATFTKRIAYIRQWLSTGNINHIWLRAFIYPKGVFNSILLDFAQKHFIDVTECGIQYEFTTYTDISSIPATNDSEPVYHLYPLYMFNAHYNSESEVLEDLPPDGATKLSKWGEKFAILPAIAVIPGLSQSEKVDGYECPLYYFPKKIDQVGKSFSNLINNINCPTDLKNQYWIFHKVFISCVDPEKNG